MTWSDKLSRGFAAVFLSRTLKMAANALLLVVLARFLLSPDQYGLLYLTISIVGIVRLFSDLGLSRATARYLNEFKETDAGQVPHVLRLGFTYRAVLAVSVALVLALANDPIGAYFDDPGLEPYVVVGAIYLVCISMRSFVGVLFQGFSRVTYSALVGIVDSVARVVFVLGFVLLGFGALGALAGFAVAAALASIVGAVVLYTRYYAAYDDDSDQNPELKRRLLEYSIPLTATKSANVVDKRLDTVLVGALAGPAAAGFYTVGKQVASFLDVPARSLGFTVSPAYSEEKAQEHLAEAARMYERSVRYILLLYVPGAVGLMLVADPGIVFVFGEDYASAVPVVQLMSLFVLFQSVNLVTTQGLDFLGRARERAIAKGVTAVANVALNVLLIPRYGAAGAAGATAVTFGAYTLANVYIMHQELPVRIGRLLVTGAKVVGISIGMGAVVAAALPLADDLESLVGVVVTGVVVWGLLATGSGLLEIEDVRSLIP